MKFTPVTETTILKGRERKKEIQYSVPGGTLSLSDIYKEPVFFFDLPGTFFLYWRM